MAHINKVSGSAYLDKNSLKEGDVMKLVSEAIEEEGKFGMQIVGKVRVKGDTGEAKSFAVNGPSVNALIEAFGEDSKNWCNQILTVHIEKVRSAGRKGISVYLIPEGFDFWDDENGYLVIGRLENKPTKETVSSGPNPDDIPF